jgi:signal transduction histidine kinase
MIGQFIIDLKNWIPPFELQIRLFFIWIASLFLLKYDQSLNFDTRFQVRGNLTTNNEIILIELKPSDIQFKSNFGLKSLIMLNENSQLNDNYYWDAEFWVQLLGTLLKLNPKGIGISLNLAPAIEKDSLSSFFLNTLLHHKVFWTNSDVLQFQDVNTKSNFLIELGLIKDPDGIIRRFEKQFSKTFAEKITRMNFPYIDPIQPVNFKGTAERYKKFYLNDFFNLDIKHLQNKYIIIGAATNNDFEFNTPMGTFDRSSLMALTIENYINKDWIRSSSFFFYSLLLILFLMLSFLLSFHLQQTVSLGGLVFCLLFYLTANVYLFDKENVWLPLFSPLFISLLTWFFIVTYKASQFEKNNFILLQEKKNHTELEQLKNNFVSLISHDLKTPLAKIQGISDRILFNSPSENIKKDIITIRKSGEELNGYIKSILNLLRVESQNFVLNKENYDINELILRSIEILAPLAEEKQIKIVTELEPLFPIDVDPTLIKEAFQNIIENAIKYSFPKSEIQIISKEINDNIIVSIKDFGCGISSNDLKIIGRKFVRGKDQAFDIKGTGLGLYLVKYFIDLHKGSVDISSETSSIEKSYTEVKITLPTRTT